MGLRKKGENTPTPKLGVRAPRESSGGGGLSGPCMAGEAGERGSGWDRVEANGREGSPGTVGSCEGLNEM